MKKMLVLVAVVLAAVVLSSAASQAQAADEIVCDGAVAVEGRCVSVDQHASLCALVLCVEFVEESVSICPAPATNVEPDPVADPRCVLAETALQRDDSCPEGARGEAGGCFIFVAIGPDGCPPGSTFAASGNCEKPIFTAQGSLFCVDVGASLQGVNCESVVDAIPSPCPAGTARFDGACWRLNGLAAPETCAGHQVAGTVTLDSGLCQVPLAIPTGPSACIDGAQYREHPTFILFDGSDTRTGDGPLEIACVDDSVSVGLAIASCFFPDDPLPWGSITIGSTPDNPDPAGNDELSTKCSRFTEPAVQVCPAGYSIDDSLGGVCARFELAINGVCPAGGSLNGASCVFESEFAEFECPSLTERFLERSICIAFRELQSAVVCGNRLLLLPDGSYFGCFAYQGPQPDTCNGEGTLESCFEIREPVAIDCGQTVGCVSLEASVATCGDLVVTVDLNASPAGAPTDGDDVILGTSGADVIDGSGGDDVICSGSGDDRVTGGAGHDVIFGGPGDDRLFGAQGFDEIYGGEGDDTIHGNRGNDTLHGDAGADRIFGYAHDDIISGGDGDDRLHGNFGDDVIDGGAGNDQVFGYGDDDTLSGGAGDDLISGNFGDDVIDGGIGNDVLFGADGDDTVSGGEGDDQVNGNSLNDTLSGGIGDDILDGGIGRDSCDGGLGTDTATRCETLTAVP